MPPFWPVLDLDLAEGSKDTSPPLNCIAMNVCVQNEINQEVAGHLGQPIIYCIVAIILGTTSQHWQQQEQVAVESHLFHQLQP